MPLEISLDCKACGNAQTVTISRLESEQLACLRCGAVLCRLRNVPGYLYILSNAHMPGLLKIGLTTRSVSERVAELNSATGVPTAFTVEAYFESRDPDAHEAAIHQRLDQYRVPSREFFKIGIKETLAVARAVTGCEPVGFAALGPEGVTRRPPDATRGGIRTHRRPSTRIEQLSASQRRRFSRRRRKKNLAIWR
jgi:hypothetical protein